MGKVMWTWLHTQTSLERSISTSLSLSSVVGGMVMGGGVISRATRSKVTSVRRPFLSSTMHSLFFSLQTYIQSWFNTRRSPFNSSGQIRQTLWAPLNCAVKRFFFFFFYLGQGHLAQQLSLSV